MATSTELAAHATRNNPKYIWSFYGAPVDLYRRKYSVYMYYWAFSKASSFLLCRSYSITALHWQQYPGSTMLYSMAFHHSCGEIGLQCHFNPWYLNRQHATRCPFSPSILARLPLRSFTFPLPSRLNHEAIRSFLIHRHGRDLFECSAFTIKFQNNCDYTVWAAIGKASYGSPDPSVAYGSALGTGVSTSYTIDDSLLGIRAWGRTGCSSDGSGCATGGCNGGMVCTDAGITSGVILSEYGYADFGANYGGVRTSWDLSIVDATINIPTTLGSSDGQTVVCTSSSCPADQAYTSTDDYAADRNSAPGATYTHSFC